jgi:hypothetical protein
LRRGLLIDRRRIGNDRNIGNRRGLHDRRAGLRAINLLALHLLAVDGCLVHRRRSRIDRFLRRHGSAD